MDSLDTPTKKMSNSSSPITSKVSLPECVKNMSLDSFTIPTQPLTKLVPYNSSLSSEDLELSLSEKRRKSSPVLVPEAKKSKSIYESNLLDNDDWTYGSSIESRKSFVYENSGKFEDQHYPLIFFKSL